ncbi:MAG: hypothetical protein GW893_04765 [Armatimonadetes bacterium]|nr:hypothetical protein [Armatimonadota bacterium]PIU64124.1 MAG: hypothetical protein COS85_13720 [Armatimonadetes bacterium CG07_land_8_20_14_0_80_59_28]PIX40968.1 MAG: hypothetical protein COZ56_13260 [Armatimonadetes bacterium CG_4_8_14_3_um_filter_58_9]PIY37004.1 MAG: hypothetical protein COZ05_23125 [Armatimonadetes bacterium CG_4_10_14_3_um_filter_59_10]PJB73452.1 MAG: hypothetical protein CO095_05790 [Armatimonadetes bacterium CG_4_9_14_3_um_filter_58_7]
MAAPDFYFAINATFRHVHDKYGEDALIGYWEAMGDDYFHALSQRLKEGGLEAIEGYWREFFETEPGGEVDVSREENQVNIDVRDCPAIRHLKEHNRVVMPLYCRHCYHVSSVIARKAGMTFELEGGGGSCRQVFNSKVP